MKIIGGTEIIFDSGVVAPGDTPNTAGTSFAWRPAPDDEPNWKKMVRVFDDLHFKAIRRPTKDQLDRFVGFPNL